MTAALEFRHVDVFTDVPFSGNGLIVLFGETTGARAEALITLTVEMRQFESVLVDAEPETGRVSARIFTAEEELPFAGHPVIGAAAALHSATPPASGHGRGCSRSRVARSPCAASGRRATTKRR